MNLVNVHERLMGEFEHQVDLAVINGVVRHVRDELEGVSVGLSPVAVERLSRRRLIDLVAYERAPRVERAPEPVRTEPVPTEPVVPWQSRRQPCEAHWA